MKTTRKMKREALRNDKPFNILMFIIRHYFPNFLDILDMIKDPRNQSYITYHQIQLIMTSLYSSICQHSSRREMNDSFNKDTVINNFKILFGFDLEEIPHGDTIDNYFKLLDIDDLRKVLYSMFKDLMKKKVFDGYLVEDEYYQFIIDGSNFITLHDDKIQGSIKKNHKDSDPTYHNMYLVCLIKLGNTMIPIDFEPIENKEEKYDKQDCEINASKRLLARIKDNFKRLKIMVSADGLYLNEPMIKIMDGYKWKYMFTFKDNRPLEIKEYYEACKKGKDTIVIEKEYEGIKTRYEYYNGIVYRENELNMIEIEETKNGKTTKFCYCTNIEITKKNYKNIANAGRHRWKIENEGFNNLKNHAMNITHIYSYDSNAAKAYVAINLISYIIVQLMRHYEKTKNIEKTFKLRALDIQEALRTSVLSASDIEWITQPRYISNTISF